MIGYKTKKKSTFTKKAIDSNRVSEIEENKPCPVKIGLTDHENMNKIRDSHVVQTFHSIRLENLTKFQ